MRRLRSPLKLPASHRLPPSLAEILSQTLEAAEREYTEARRKVTYEGSDAARAQLVNAETLYGELEAAVRFVAAHRTVATA